MLHRQVGNIDGVESPAQGLGFDSEQVTDVFEGDRSPSVSFVSGIKPIAGLREYQSLSPGVRVYIRHVTANRIFKHCEQQTALALLVFAALDRCPILNR
jgi:hypothetical protein